MIGHWGVAHGLKGAITLVLKAETADWLKVGSQLFFQEQVHLCESFSAIKNRRVTIKVKTINDRTAAEQLRGVEVFVPAADLVAAPGETIFLREILHFTLWDRAQELGQIHGFSSNGVQDLLCFTWQGREVLVPFVREWLVNIDFTNKKVLMELPEGLLDAQT